MSTPLTCKNNECDRKHYAKGLCELHYRRWRTGGGEAQPGPCTFPGCSAPRRSRWRCVEHFARGGLACSVDGCDGKHYGKGLCKFHWGRKVAGLPLNAPKFVPIKVCTFDSCSKPHWAKGLCKTHLDRLNLWGDPAISKKRPVPPPRSGPDNATWKGTAAGYHAVHKRLETARGKASSHVCACGSAAAQWAYDGLDPAQKTATIKSSGRPVVAAFSHDLDHYVAMCVRCHIAYDRR